MKYTITNSQPSIDKNTGQQYKDGYGNLSWSLMVQDEQNQYYSILKRTKAGSAAPKVGDVLEGTVTSEMSKSGNSYFKFTPAPKENTYSGKSSSDPDTMLISYAKDLTIALINNINASKDVTKLTTENVMSDLDTFTYHLKGLYESLKGEKKETPKQSQVITANEETHNNDDIDLNEVPF